MKTLLLGMGNPILSDDAIGVRLARDIGRQLRGTPDLTVIEECSVGGLNIIEILAGCDRVVVLDSIRTQHGAPGDWYRFTAARLRETLHLNNVHDANFATALELGRRMGTPLPPDDEIHIFAVEVKDAETFSENLTPELEQAYSAVAEEILAEIRGLLAPSEGGS